MLLRSMEFLGRHATRALAIGVLIGLAVPQLAELLRPLLIPGLIVPLTIALVRLDWKGLVAYARRPLLIGLLALWVLVISPVAMAAVTAPLGLPEALRTALVLMAAAPPIVSAAVLALILGLDAPLMVVVILTTTALVPLTLPPMALLLLGLNVGIGLAELMLRLGALVGFAFLAAAIIRRLVAPHWIERRAQLLDGVAVSNMLVFAIAIMAGVTEVVLSRPQFVVLILLAAFTANLALQAIGAVVFTWLGRREALSIGLLNGNRNMGLVLVALADRADFDVAVYFALAQLPMYILPALLLPVYRKLMRS